MLRLSCVVRAPNEREPGFRVYVVEMGEDGEPRKYRGTMILPEEALRIARGLSDDFGDMGGRLDVAWSGVPIEPISLAKLHPTAARVLKFARQVLL